MESYFDRETKTMAEFSINQPWDDLREAFMSALTKDNDDEVEEVFVKDFKSAFDPALPPLMTPEKREECRMWRKKAIEVERKVIVIRQRPPSSKAMIVDLSDRDDLSSQEEEEQRQLHDLSPQEQDDFIDNNAFKNLIHKLRSSIKSSSVLQDDDEQQQHQQQEHQQQCQQQQHVQHQQDLYQRQHVQHHHQLQYHQDMYQQHHHQQQEQQYQQQHHHQEPQQQLQQQQQFGEVDADDDEQELESPPEQRRRSNSYTLEEPSPLLRAYIQRYGEADMTSPGHNPRGQSDDPRSKEERLSSFLEDVSAMPGMRSVEGQQQPRSSIRTLTEGYRGHNDDCSDISTSSPDSTLNQQAQIKDINKVVNKEDEESEEMSVLSPAASTMLPSSATTMTHEPPSKSNTSATMTNSKVPPAMEVIEAGAEPMMSPIKIQEPAPDLAMRQDAQMNETNNQQAQSEDINKVVDKEDEELEEMSVLSAAASTMLPSLATTTTHEPPSMSDSSTTTTVAAVPPAIEVTESAAEPMTSSVKIQEAVSSLAMKQKAQVQALMEAQNQQRQELQKLFEEQQQTLMAQILGSLKEGEKINDHLTTTIRTRSSSPVIPTLRMNSALTSQVSEDCRIPSNALNGEMRPKFDPVSTVTKGYLTSSSVKEGGTIDDHYLTSIRSRSLSPVIPTLRPSTAMNSALTARVSEDYRFPSEALSEEMRPKFDRVSAAAKGYLTRRLLRTGRVRSLLTSMKDTMSAALDLHRSRSVKAEDVDLHRRLLQQLNKDSQAIHDLFFKMTPEERMKLIKNDLEEIQRPKDKSKRRISSATAARLEAKEKMLRLQQHGSPRLKVNAGVKRRRRMTSALSNGSGLHSARRSLLYAGGHSSTSSAPIKAKKTSMSKKKPWK